MATAPAGLSLWVYRVSAFAGLGRCRGSKTRCKSGGIGEIGGFSVQCDDVVDAETTVIGNPLKSGATLG